MYRRHVETFHTDSGYYPRDLNTTNGTFLNQIAVGEFQSSLRDGEQICIGRTDISFMFRSNISKTIKMQTRLTESLTRQSGTR